MLLGNQMKNTNLVVTKSLIGHAEDLAREHELFNQQYVVAGRAALYGLLQKIMQLSEAFDASPDKEDLIKLMRVQLLNDYGIKTQDNSSDASVLVRFVTRADRKTAHVYARAIESAKANNIKANKFVEYVLQQGGIERIRAIGVDPEVKKAEKELDTRQMQDMWEFLRIRSEAPCATFELRNGKGEWHGTSALHYFVAHKKGDQYQVIAEILVEDENEDAILQPFKEAVAQQLEKDPDSLVKLRKTIEDKKLKLSDNNVAQTGEEKCAA